MIELLREHQLAKRFRDLTRDGGSLYVAVAFWGKGAIKKLGLSPASRGRVICNLESPACNPHEIKALVELGHIKVRSHPRLHAKLYAGKGFVIVGSSNVSTNGLNEDGRAAAGWIEANLLTNDKSTTEVCAAMFADIWDRATRRVTVKMADEAIRIWRPIKGARPLSAMSLFEAVRADPAAFECVWVMAYELGLDKAADLAIENAAEEASPTGEITPSAILDGWCYQIETPLHRDAWMIDLDCRPTRTKPKVHGAAQVSGVHIKVPGQHHLTHAIRGKIRLGDGRTFVISNAEKQALCGASKRLLKEGSGDGLVKIARAVEIIDRKGRQG